MKAISGDFSLLMAIFEVVLRLPDGKKSIKNRNENLSKIGLQAVW